MPTIVHFEIPADEVERARRFYQGLFGWQIEQVPGMEYWFVTTSGERHLDGGMMQRKGPQHSVTNYVDVNSVEEYAAKVEKLGGKVVVPKTAIPGMGYMAVCLDTEGNPFGLWHTDQGAR